MVAIHRAMEELLINISGIAIIIAAFLWYTTLSIAEYLEKVNGERPDKLIIYSNRVFYTIIVFGVAGVLTYILI